MKILTAALLSIILVACGPTQRSQQELLSKQQFDLMRDAGINIAISRKYTSFPNSVGGVNVGIDVTNLSNKTIKYLRFNVSAYNAVGDKVRGEISRSSSANIYATGPFVANGFNSLSWSNVWYNNSIRCTEITSMIIEYMDGSKRTYTGRSQLEQFFTPPIDKNNCSKYGM